MQMSTHEMQYLETMEVSICDTWRLYIYGWGSVTIYLDKPGNLLAAREQWKKIAKLKRVPDYRSVFGWPESGHEVTRESIPYDHRIAHMQDC